MSTRAISCAYCGMQGKIEIWGIDDDENNDIFNYIGHNPLSGHMHFQCPHCKIVFLINPMSVLGKDIICADINSRGSKEESFLSYLRKDDLWQLFLSKISKLIQVNKQIINQYLLRKLI